MSCWKKTAPRPRRSGPCRRCARRAAAGGVLHAMAGAWGEEALDESDHVGVVQQAVVHELALDVVVDLIAALDVLDGEELAARLGRMSLAVPKLPWPRVLESAGSYLASCSVTLTGDMAKRRRGSGRSSSVDARARARGEVRRTTIDSRASRGCVGGKPRLGLRPGRAATTARRGEVPRGAGTTLRARSDVSSSRPSRGARASSGLGAASGVMGSTFPRADFFSQSNPPGRPRNISAQPPRGEGGLRAILVSNTRFV